MLECSSAKTGKMCLLVIESFTQNKYRSSAKSTCYYDNQKQHIDIVIIPNIQLFFYYSLLILPLQKEKSAIC